MPAAKPRDGAVAFVGAGGKTTAMFQLARQLPPPVLITTSTHLATWQIQLADQHLTLAQARHEFSGGVKSGGVLLVTEPLGSDDRFSAPSGEGLAWLHDIAKANHIPLLIEADGARQKPLKAPGPHEPAIPPFSDLIVVVAGLSGLGKPLSETFVHRPELFASRSGLGAGDRVSADGLVRVLKDSEEGGLKNVPAGTRRVILLNQADTDELRAQARGMVTQLLGSYDSALICTLQTSTVHAVHEPVAGIVLAAGASRRLGQPKQLLDWHGQPFVRAVAGTALRAGLNPVVVVTGSDSERVTMALEGLPVQVAHNDSWQSGQASSIRAGVAAIPEATGGAVFMLTDQPQVRFDVITALVEAHSLSLPPIVAPLVVMERRANPVLFDRVTFQDLLALQGDVGGRAIFDKYHVEYMPWHDDRLLLDVDTQADYRRLIEDDTL
ncbi:MAG TPA: selenium cofactor biosynthesis protein YqeC [Anaerolineales bacterium]